MTSEWIEYVKKIYYEERKKNNKFKYSDALKLASKKKGNFAAKGKSRTRKSRRN
jgi:hypothetical protein